MSRALRWRRRALDDLSQLGRRDPSAARRIGDALDRFAQNGHGDIRKLEGSDGEYRLRVGNWRVIFVLEDEGRAIVVTRVLDRRDAHRR